MAAASVVFGILALLTCVMPVIGIITSIIALIIAIIAMASKKTRGENTGAKATGLGLAIFSAIVAFAITYFLVNIFTMFFDIAGEAISTSKQIYENPETQELVSDLYEEYLGIRIYNLLTKDDITLEEAERRYIDILMNEYREIYNQGYDIRVDDEYKFKIVSPE